MTHHKHFIYNTLVWYKRNQERIAKVKEAFNRKVSLLTSKLNIEVRKKLVRCYICIVWLRDLDTKKIGMEVSVDLQNMVLEEVKREDKIEKITNEEIIEHIGD